MCFEGRGVTAIYSNIILLSYNNLKMGASKGEMGFEIKNLFINEDE